MVFLAVFFILTSLTHLVLYRFVLRVLGVAHPLARTILMAVFALLAVSFMAAFLLLRWQENALTIGFYRVSAVWFALAINLILAAGATWVIYGALRVLGAGGTGFRIAGGVLALGALAFSAFGFWSAFHPRVKHVEITLDNLPPSWQDKKIVQLSDVHLGHFHGAGSMERLAQEVAAQSPELVLITGDLFDGMTDGMPEFAGALKRLAARRGVFFVSGNHEVYAGLRRCLDMVAGAGIRVLFNEVVAIDGLNLMGIAYPGIGHEQEIRGLELIWPPRENPEPCILLFHTPTDIRSDGTRDRRTATYWHPDTSFALSRKLGVSLQLSGHTHRGQLFPFGLLTHWIYGGYDYGLHRDGRFAVYITSGVGTWGPPMRTGAAPEIAVFTLKKAGG
jgi:predicted MPP superfamily phosphohydrolase